MRPAFVQLGAYWFNVAHILAIYENGRGQVIVVSSDGKQITFDADDARADLPEGKNGPGALAEGLVKNLIRASTP